MEIGIEKTTDKKAMLKRMTPILLFAVIILVFWFIFFNLYLKDMYFSDGIFKLNTQEQEQAKIVKLINFIESDSFNNLIYTPNPSVFDPVININFVSGKSNPFAEN
jgi:capsule polysaccharide export protein KpsE/RkpR